jgi:hypothetical protein
MRLVGCTMFFRDLRISHGKTATRIHRKSIKFVSVQRYLRRQKEHHKRIPLEMSFILF